MAFSLRSTAQLSPMPATQDDSLEGIWQLVNLRDAQGEVEMRVAPYLKILSRDGEFHNVLIGVAEGGSKITAQGTFTRLTDSTYLEVTSYSLDTAMTGFRDTVSYQLQGGRWLVAEYNRPGKAERLHELWMRVEPLRRQPIEPRGRHKLPHRAE